ncbi:hypothetical protein D3H55_21760 [Bacillus salacetis]|uniref:Protein kinase domain-containing protein n=1 Tax=Bacillus salacetis TaxID=2315464 RepID=A0A3A1QNB2_9BACI|nr:protein kinase [Bacillus salacetis]RIW28516.1 hypothetical protein D3H55_21760 [Bacillus salacetis]
MGVWRETVNFFEKEWNAGTRIDDYIVISLLGKGSYGTAYLVREGTDGRLAVLKKLRPYKQLIDQSGKLLNWEADVLRKLDSPHFPKLMAFGNHKKVPYFVMEYFEGKTFDQLIFEKGKSFDERESLHIVKELVKLVKIIHETGIVHRDLRIPNILLDGSTLRIIDFGLAANIESEGRTMLKHKDYMREKSIHADYYALGHFLLFLLYSSYESEEKKEKSWEEELQLSEPTKGIIRKLLQIEKPYEDSTTLVQSLESAAQKIQ